MDFGRTISIDELPEPDGHYDLLPDGWYPAFVKAAAIMSTKDKTGEYLSIHFGVTEPKGRVVFGSITLKNWNEISEKIGGQQLRELLASVGLKTIRDTDTLLNLDLDIKVRTEKSEGYEPKNVVKGFRARVGSIPPVVTTQAPKSTKAPWG